MIHAQTDAAPALVFPAEWRASCTAMTGAPGWAIGVRHDDGTIEIRLDQCALIVRAQTGKLRTAYDVRDAAEAVATVAHELSHQLGTHDANVTAAGEDPSEPDCVAWLLYRWVARKLQIPAPMITKLIRYEQPRGVAACKRAGIL